MEQTFRTGAWPEKTSKPSAKSAGLRDAQLEQRLLQRIDLLEQHLMQRVEALESLIRSFTVRE
ncbi:hypothetical protein [Synechococcus sp. CS-1328]|uniref:hypothetical protein n=1 Tax=Synechococcus sp. CS-1328 TaxID=2847976 RepID=UPI00223B9A8F|nr:hypothetical protein [Synechococcus sp. CS-1328]MCT0224879.1 hypothetical protein [Synechococcus sp. CS-1328]